MMSALSRRSLLQSMLGVAVGSMAPFAKATVGIPMEVWKDPQCGCCADWVALMIQAGFTVKVNDVGNAARRTALGMPKKYGSCHTATVGGYVIEGHVPSSDIHRLLEIKPKALGLAVPGMPVGSPGMDGAVYKGRRDPYDVLLIGAAGSSTVFRSVR
jgi:hypothetical protein